MSDPVLPEFLGRLHRAAAATHDLLAHSRVPRWEVFAKASSVREVMTPDHGAAQLLEVEETGVAVRTWRHGLAGFAAASGIEAGASRNAVDGALANAMASTADPLPPARLLGTTTATPNRPTPAAGWAAHVSDELVRATTGASGGRLRLLRTTVHEGRFAWVLATGEGFVAAFEGASCALLTEAVLADGSAGVWRDWIWVPDPEAFAPERAAMRLADRLLLTGGTTPPEPGVRDVLLHSEVTAHLLAALVPLFLATPDIRDPLPRLLDRAGRLATPELTLLDDGAGQAGPLTAPCDGEGIAAARTTLLDAGIPRHRLACYRDAQLCAEPPRGGAVRHSYRNHPRTGIRNLQVVTAQGLPPARLLAETDRAVYLLRLLAPVEVDLSTDEVRLVATGVSVDHGRPRGWHPVVEVRGGLGRMLRRVAAVGTDLEWYQTSPGCIGAPSLLIRHQPVR